MKKIFVFSLIFLTFVSLVISAAMGDNVQNRPSSEVASGAPSGNGSYEGAVTNVQSSTQNQGSDNQLQTQAQVRAKTGTYEGAQGKQIQVQEKANNRFEIKSGNVEAGTSLELRESKSNNSSKFEVKLSNGKNSEIKVMPDVASERALERLRLKVCSSENNCTIELKETGSGDEAKATYEVQIERHSRILGIFSKKMQVRVEVDAETGETKVNKPWWAFIATEPAEE